MLPIDKMTLPRQRILEYLTLLRIIDKLRNSNHDFDENYRRSEGDTGEHYLILDSSSSSELKHAVCHHYHHYRHQYHLLQNSNMLSAILCLIKEIDAPSLEVVELAARL